MKNSLTIGRSPYQWQHEPVLFGWLPNGKHKWYARWTEEFITQHGSIFKTPSGYVQQVPQVSIAQQNLKIMQSLAGEFGLSPATRFRIIAAGGGTGGKDSEDPMEQLLNGAWKDGD